MATEQIYTLCKDIQAFIKFDVEIKPKHVMSCIGFEYICANTECDCQSVHIAVYQKTRRKRLTFIIYGWRDYSYYIASGNTKSEAKRLVAAKLSDSEPETELNKVILEAFRRWLSKDKAEKDEIFAARYKQFKLALRNTQAKKRHTKLQKLFNLMYELFGEAKVKEFIAGCEQSREVKLNPSYQVATVHNIENFKSND